MSGFIKGWMVGIAYLNSDRVNLWTVTSNHRSIDHDGTVRQSFYSTWLEHTGYRTFNYSYFTHIHVPCNYLQGMFIFNYIPDNIV